MRLLRRNGLKVIQIVTIFLIVGLLFSAIFVFVFAPSPLSLGSGVTIDETWKFHAPKTDGNITLVNGWVVDGVKVNSSGLHFDVTTPPSYILYTPYNYSDVSGTLNVTGVAGVETAIEGSLTSFGDGIKIYSTTSKIEDRPSFDNLDMAFTFAIENTGNNETMEVFCGDEGEPRYVYMNGTAYTLNNGWVYNETRTVATITNTSSTYILLFAGGTALIARSTIGLLVIGLIAIGFVILVIASDRKRR